jgi:hypothetical protein
MAIMQMNNVPENKQLFRKEHDEMWHYKLLSQLKTTVPYNTHFNGYGLGWF